MNNFAAATRISDSHSIIRVAEKKDHFFEPPGFEVPRLTIFFPSPTDVKEGEGRGLQPIISVWDAQLSVDRVLEIRSMDPDKTWASRISVRRITEIGEQTPDPTYAPLEVHRDANTSLGSDGEFHYALQGLYSLGTSKTAKKTRMKRAQALLDEPQLPKTEWNVGLSKPT